MSGHMQRFCPRRNALSAPLALIVPTGPRTHTAVTAGTGLLARRSSTQCAPPRPLRENASPVVRRGTIEQGLKPAAHPLDSTIDRRVFALGDAAGLTQQGITYARVPKGGKRSTVPHWHAVEDEWYFILEGSGTLLLAEDSSGYEGPEEGKGEESGAFREVNVKKGDFIGFPAGEEARMNAHALQSSMDEELVYLCGGTRASLELVRYPGHERALIIDRTPTSSTARTTMVAVDRTSMQLAGR